jgi:putative sporulation protein YyaC
MEANLSEGDYETNYKVISKDIYESFLKSGKKNVVLLCIGCCTAIGDSLGPLVGEKVVNSFKHIKAYGTPNNEINGRTYREYYSKIIRKNPCSFYIAVDAMISSNYSIGSLVYSETPIYPCKGFGVQSLSMGNVSIKGSIGYPKDKPLIEYLFDVPKSYIDKMIDDIVYLLKLVDDNLEEYYNVN